MSPILIGIAVVVIIAILAGVFFMSKRRSGGTDITPAATNRPKTLSELQQARTEQPQVSATPMAAPTPAVRSADEDLANAQRFLEQQDYASAANTLKQAIKTHPTRGDLQVLLLNTFAQAKNYDNFNQYYPQVLKLNDPTTTQQANNLKQLMDEELAFSQASQQVEEKPAPVSEGLDFDFFDQAEEQLTTQPVTTPVAPKASVSEVPDDLSFDLNLDDTSVPAVSTPQQAVATPTHAVENDVDLDMDFDFDIPTNEPVASPTPAVPAKEVVLADGGELSFDDFSFDETPVSAPAPVASAPTVSATADDDLDLDFDLSSDFDTTSTKATATPAPVATPSASIEEDFDFGDFDMGSSVSPTVDTPVNVPAKNLTSTDDVVDTDFDFDLPEIETQSPAPTSVAPVSASLSETSLADDMDFNFDIDSSTPSEPSAPSAPVAQPAVPETTMMDDSQDLGFDDLDFSFETEKVAQQDALTIEPQSQSDTTLDFVTEDVQPVATQNKVETVATLDDADFATDFDSATQLDNLAFDTAHTANSVSDTTANPTISEPASELFADDFSFDSDISPTSTTPVIETTETVAPIAPVDISASSPVLGDAFALLKDVDTVALNVELAEQYVNLGEYDSAKRLLDEINTQASPELQSKVQQLLEKIG